MLLQFEKLVFTQRMKNKLKNTLQLQKIFFFGSYKFFLELSLTTLMIRKIIYSMGKKYVVKI